MEPKNPVSKSKLIFFDFFLLSLKDTIPGKYLKIVSASALLSKLSLFIFFSFLGLSLFSQTNYDIKTNNGQTISTCGGHFYDSGGALGDYGDNENYTVTFNSLSGQNLRFTFTNVFIRSGDALNVYDGPDTSSPLIGSYSGPGAYPSAVPNFIINSTGTYLTFNFKSDVLFGRAGWDALIECFICTPPVTSPILPAATEVCPGQTITYSVDFHPGSTYTWTVTNGTPASVVGGSNSLAITWDFFGGKVGKIRVDETNACGTDFQTSGMDIFPAVIVDFSGLNSSYCIGDTPATLSGNPIGGVFIGPGISGNTFTPSIAGTGTHNIIYSYPDPLSGCTFTKEIQTTVNLNTVTLTSAPGTDNQSVCINTPITNITYSTTIATGATFSGLPAGVTGSWAANTITISGSPTVSGPFNYTVTLTGGCGNITTNGTLTVTPANTITFTSAAGTNSQTVCINTPITNITYGTTGATGATVTGLPAGVTGSWASDVVTITGTPSVPGPFNYTVTLTGGCGNITATGTINVTPDNTITLTSGAGTDNQSVCVNTAITSVTYATTGVLGATVTGLPAGVTGTWASNVVTIGGTPTASGPFTYTITLTGGCGIVTATGTITVTPANTVNRTSAAGTDAQTVCVNTAIANITYATTGATGATVTGLPAGVTGNWAANVVTISGTPAASGPFTYTVTLTGGCGIVTATGTITVTPNNTITRTSAAGTNTQKVCINTAITNITYATTGATGATVTGLPAGVTGTWAANVVTISGTPSVAGVFTYTVTLSGGCGIVTATGTITVDANNTINLTSAVGTDNQSVCINNPITTITYATTGATGANFSGMPAGMTVGWVANVVTISGTPSTSGVYNYVITLTGGCGTVTTTGRITVSANNTITRTSAAGTNSQTVCINTAITNITYSTTGATGATITGLPAGVTGAWAANVVTISGIPSVSGPSTYTITLTGGCGTTTATGTINVTPGNTVNRTSAAGTDAQTVCRNTAITNITYATTGATGATVTGLPAGVTGTWATNVVTISGTPTVSGPFTYTVTLTGGCGIVTATGTITVSPVNTITRTSAAGTDGQTVCVSTAITNITYATTGATGATVTGLPAGVTGTWLANVVTISGTPSASGPFTYTVTLTGGCGTVTTTGTITVSPVNTIALTSAAGTNNQTVCRNTPIINITYSTSGATGAAVSGLPAGVSGNWAANVVTISGTPPVPGTYNYTVTLSGGCGNVTASGSIIVSPNNTINRTSAPGAQNVCVGSAITNITFATTGATGATVTGLPAGVTGSWSANVVTISGTPTVSGPFNYTVTLTGGCGNVSDNGNIIVRPNNTLNLTSAAGTDGQTVCNNTAITDITYSTTGGSGATVTGLPSGVTSTWAANVLTISGTPTASGPFTYTVTVTGGCGVVTATGTITVTPNNTINRTSAAGTDAQTICNNTAITNITYATTGATGATITGLPAGVTGSWASNVVTISGTPTASGPFTYTVTLTGGCGIITATGTVTVTPANTVNRTSVAGTDAQTVCVNTAIANITYSTTGATGATVTGLPAGITGGWAANVVTISGTPAASGPFTYTVTLTGGCGIVTATGTITVTPNNTITRTSAAGTNNQTVCNNAAITNITYSTTGATGATVTGLPAGVTGTWAADVVTISGTPTVTGPFTYTVTLTGGCGIVTATGTITVRADNTINLTSAAGTDNQTVCINIPITTITYATTGATGANFSGMPAGMTVGWVANVVTISGTPSTSGVYNYVIILTGGCGAVTTTGRITVNPRPVVTNKIATICSGNAFTVTPAGVPAGTTYTWTAPVVTGGITGGSAQAVGQTSISQTLTNPTLVAQTATYTVTPTSGACAGATFTVTVTVNPTPAVTNQTATICSGNVFNITPAGVPAGTTYTWTAPVVTGGITGGSAQAVGQASISQTLTNPTLVPQTATYTVTPLSGTCPGATFTVTITVNPMPVVTAQTAIICSGNAFTVTPAGVPAGTTYTWTAPVVTGGITGGSAQPVAQASISQTLTNPTLILQTATYTVTPLSGTCSGATFTVTVTVNPAPAITNQTATICSGNAFTVTPAGVPAGTTYTWTAPVVTGGITGGSAQAVGQTSISQTLTNPTLVAQTATYTVTPTSGTCAGATFTVIVTVNPVPAVADQIATICSGNAFTVTPAGVPAGTTYTWTAPVVTGGITGGSAQAVGQASISQTLTNPTLIVQTATYTVTPLSGTCPGATFTVTITVNPTPAVTNQTATICSGNVFTVTPAGVPAGTTYTWTAPVVTGGITGGSAQAVGQASISQTLTNPTLVLQTATYIVTPTSGTCAGATFTIIVTVNPVPAVINQTSTICSGNAFTVIPAGAPAGTTYTWTAPVVTGGITGGSAQAVGQASISQTLTNPTLIVQTATYTVTPLSGTCTGATFTVTVTVDPSPVVTNQTTTICSGNAFTVTPAGVPAGTTYTWTAPVVTGGITGGSAQAVGQTSISQTLTNPTLVAQTATYTVTPTSGICAGATFTVTVTVNPAPAVTDQTATICSGNTFTVTPAGVPAGTTYTWTAPVVTGGITGGSAQAVGQTSISQTLTNPTLVPQTATYTVAPLSGTCAGTTFTLTVTVNPVPSVANQTATICSGDAFSVTPAGVPAGTMYTWTDPVVTGGITGGTASLVSQSSISQTLTNPTLVAQTAIYTVTPASGICAGANFTITVTVNPTNSVSLTSAAGTDAQTVCVNTAIANITYATTGATGATVTGLPAGVTGSWAADVVTISGTPTASGPFSYTITLTGGCGIITATGTITVNPDNTITMTSVAGTDAQTVCVNTAISAITYATTGATGATVSGLPAGVTGNWTADVLTISGTPTASGPFTYTVTLTGGCGIVTATGTITVTPANTINRTSAAGTEAQTVCVNTAIVNITYATTGATGATITGLPAGVTGSWAADVVTISGTPSVSGPFTYTVTLTGGCGIVTATGTITVNPVNTLNLTSVAGTDAQTVCVNTAITEITYATSGATGATVTGLPAGVNGSWLADVVTISGTPIVAGPFTYTVTLTGGCEIVTTTGTISAMPDNIVNITSAAGTDAQTVCNNIAITNITYATIGATGATVTGLPAGVTGTWLADVLTISGVPTVSGPFTYTVTLTGGCGNITTTGTITVSPDNTIILTSAAGTDDQTICLGTPITDITYATTGATGAIFSGLPAGMSFTTSANTITITGTPATYGIFNYSVTLTGGCSNVVANGLIVINPDNSIDLTSAAGTDSQTACINTPITDITYLSYIASGATFTGLPAGVTGTWTGGAVTISGIPTVQGVFNYTITLTGGCGLVTTTGTITVTGDNTISLTSVAGTDAQTVCNNSAITDITYSTTGATGVAVTGLPAGVTGSWAADVVTITGTPTASGAFTYTVTLTGGCGVIAATGTITVAPENTINRTSAAGTDSQSICGSVPITDITYTTTGATGATITGLPAGVTGIWAADVVTISGSATAIGASTYTITLTGGCGVVSITGTITVNSVPSVVITDPLAQCAPSTVDLTVAAITAGSTAGLTYTYWNDALATIPYTTPVSATAGTYYIRGSDPVTNCFDIQPVTVTINPVPTVTITDPAGVCAPLTVDLTDLSVTAGSTAGLIYTYWTDPLATAAYTTPGNAVAGTYYIKGTDPVTNCFDIKPVTATVHAVPTVTITNPSGCEPSTVDITAASVTAGSTAGLTFTYWTDASATIVYATPATATAGTYFIKGTDPLTSCFDIKPVTVTINPSLTVTTTQVDEVCFGGTTGTATAIPAGGSGVYTYSWNTIPVQTAVTATGLSAGTYIVTVSDGGSCTATASVTITQPATALSGSIVSQTNVSLQGGNTGSVTVAGSGGTSPYMYSLNGGAYQVSGTFGTLTAGSYTVTVQDINLCTDIVSVTIIEPTSGLSGSITSQIPVACFGASTGSVTVEGSGGLVPYEYSLDGGAFQSSGTFGNLAAGTYTVTIRDAGLIPFNLSVTITQPASALAGSVSSLKDVLCFGGNTGTLTVLGSGATPPYMYKLGTGSYQVSGTFDNLATGSYTISVQDANMCSVDINATIGQPSGVLAITPAITNNVTCSGAADGSINVAGSGGTFPYMYSINGGTYQVSNLFSNLAAATYTLSVMDANLCTATTTVAISEPTKISITNTNEDASCPGVADGSIILTLTGGTQPYNAIWSDGVLTLDRPDIPDGTYSVVVTDKNLCAASLDIVLGVIGSEFCLEIPTIITPNNDGANDTWKIKNIDLFPNAEVLVYNRWGKLVFTSKNLSANQWDGTYKGAQLPTDSYHYILRLGDGSKPRSGVISIIR